MVVVGTFTPTGGVEPISFTTYFRAEIEVEFDLVPALEVTDEASRSIVIELNPSMWFSRADGTVWDLSESDFATTQELIRFDLEIDDGFDLRIET